MYSLLRCVAGSSSSSSSSSNFPSCSSSKESSSVYADYLRSHFSVSQPKALRIRAKSYFSGPRRATSPKESHLSFCSPFYPDDFFAATTNRFSSTASGPDKVVYLILKHLPRFEMNFLLHMFNLSWTLHSFPTIWKTSFIITIQKMGKPLDSPASIGHISLSCVSKLFERIIRSRLLFFLESTVIPFSLPDRSVSVLDGLLWIKFCFLLSPFRMSLTNQGLALQRSSLLMIFLKLLTMSGGQPFPTNSFHLASLLALLVGLHLFFLISMLAWFIKITKVTSFESVEVFRKNSLLAVYFSLSSSMIFLLLCVLPSATLFMLTIWPFGPPPSSVSDAVEATQ